MWREQGQLETTGGLELQSRPRVRTADKRSHTLHTAGSAQQLTHADTPLSKQQLDGSDRLDIRCLSGRAWAIDRRAVRNEIAG
jgi:hypothetical protein